jgi:hypothetical protein
MLVVEPTLDIGEIVVPSLATAERVGIVGRGMMGESGVGN